MPTRREQNSACHRNCLPQTQITRTPPEHDCRRKTARCSTTTVTTDKGDQPQTEHKDRRNYSHTATWVKHNKPKDLHTSDARPTTTSNNAAGFTRSGTPGPTNNHDTASGFTRTRTPGLNHSKLAAGITPYATYTAPVHHSNIRNTQQDLRNRYLYCNTPWERPRYNRTRPSGTTPR